MFVAVVVCVFAFLVCSYCFLRWVLVVVLLALHFLIVVYCGFLFCVVCLFVFVVAYSCVVLFTIC